MNPSQIDAAQFLYNEAALLDSWQLNEWVALFTDDGEYLVPSTDSPDGDPQKDLFLIFDACLKPLPTLNSRVPRRATSFPTCERSLSVTEWSALKVILWSTVRGMARRTYFLVTASTRSFGMQPEAPIAFAASAPYWTLMLCGPRASSASFFEGSSHGAL
jgi:hypothetical protein